MRSRSSPTGADDAERIALFGTAQRIASSTRLRAGPLQMDLQDGKLWRLCLGKTEVWHGLGFVFRDTEWCTPEPSVRVVESHVTERAFRIRCEGTFPTQPQPLPFTVDIEGRDDGSIRFTAEATPACDVQTNRLGLCLLHPMSVGGSRVAVEHSDGRESLSTFPTLVPPWPPFMLIRAIRHEYAADHWARCEFDGDLFELEDQRNNSDASFKTYSRSNLMPRPYWLRAGGTVRQSAQLRVEAGEAGATDSAPSPVRVRVGAAGRELPPVGVEMIAGEEVLSAPALQALAALRPAHLHLSLDAAGAAVDWAALAQALNTASARLRVDVRLADVSDGARVLDALRTKLAAARIEPESLAVFPSEPSCVQAARDRFPQSRIGGGTPHFFVQLHRAERLGATDFLSFTTCPIVHGTREEEVMLTLQSLPSLIDTLRAKHAAPLRVGPSTIAARDSPLGAQPQSDGTRRIALARRDPRCRGLFGAAWLLGYVAQLARTDVEALTLMSVTGDSGVIEASAEGGSLRFPAYFALQELCRGGRIRHVDVSQPEAVAALALELGGESRLLLANLTGKPVTVEIEGVTAEAVSLMDLSSWPVFASAVDPWHRVRSPAAALSVTVGAYGVARVALRG